MGLKMTNPNNNIDILYNNDPYYQTVLEKLNGNNYCDKKLILKSKQ